MMWQHLSILLVLTASFSIADDNRATITSGGVLADVTNLYVQSDFGTPYQVLKSRLLLNGGESNPQLINNRTCTNGFNPSASSTFVWTSSFPEGIYGTDTIIFGDPINQPNTPFRILNEEKDCDPDNSYISLRPSKGGDDFTFVADFLKKQTISTAIIHYDTIGVNGISATTASITLAKAAPDLCEDDWTYIDSVRIDGYDAWAVKANQLTHNKDFLPNATKAKLSIDNYNLYIPEPYYTKLSKQLKVSTDGFIACDTVSSDIIDFNIDGSHIILSPNEYIDHSTVDKYGTCKSRIKCQDPELDYFTLPLTIFRKYCLLLDYKNKQIGITLSTTASSSSFSTFVKRRDHV